MGLSLSPERGHEGRIREVLQEDHCSSMYSNFLYAFVIHISCRYFLHSGNLIHNADWYLFSQVINKP